jgi:uncharacterized coiled-coil protein SlyX
MKSTTRGTTRASGAFPEEEPSIAVLAGRVRELEIKVMFLERQAGGQDRAMLEQYRETERLRAEVKRLAGALAAQNSGRDAGGHLWENERPPHY